MKLSSKCVRQSSKCERPTYYMVSPETRTRCNQQQNGVAVGKNGRFMGVFDGTMSIPVEYSKTRVRKVPLEEHDKYVFEGSSSSPKHGMTEIPLYLLRKSTLVMIIEDLAKDTKIDSLQPTHDHKCATDIQWLQGEREPCRTCLDQGHGKMANLSTSENSLQGRDSQSQRINEDSFKETDEGQASMNYRSDKDCYWEEQDHREVPRNLELTPTAEQGRHSCSQRRSSKDIPCRYFEKGFCKWEAGCQFQHVKPNEVAHFRKACKFICIYCGLFHEVGKENCLAYEKTCHSCGLKNHFKKMCKTKATRVEKKSSEKNMIESRDLKNDEINCKGLVLETYSKKLEKAVADNECDMTNATDENCDLSKTNMETEECGSEENLNVDKLFGSDAILSLKSSSHIADGRSHGIDNCEKHEEMSITRSSAKMEEKMFAQRIGNTRRKPKQKAKRSAGSIDANTSAIDQSNLEDVKMMLEIYEKSGRLKDKNETQKLEFFRNSVDEEIVETLKYIDPESELDSWDALVAKVDFLLLPKKKENECFLKEGRENM